MEYEEISEDYDIDPFEVHLLEKEKRFKSMERQKCHKQRLTYEIRHSAGYKPCVVKRTYHLKLEQLKREEA